MNVLMLVGIGVLAVGTFSLRFAGPALRSAGRGRLLVPFPHSSSRCRARASSSP